MPTIVSENGIDSFLPSVWQAVKYHSEELDLDPVLIASIVKIESGGNTLAIRYEPNYSWVFELEFHAKKLGSSLTTEKMGQMTSWGLMQVMGAVAREHGFRGWFPELCRPEVGIRYGCLHFKKFKKKYVETAAAIAAYNAGSPRKKDSGDFVNQAYVDKVFKQYSMFKDGGIS